MSYEFSHKKYAKLSTYGRLAIPLSLLEKIVDQCYYIDTTYENGEEFINHVKPIRDFSIIDKQELLDGVAQMKLEGK